MAEWLKEPGRTRRALVLARGAPQLRAASDLLRTTSSSSTVALYRRNREGEIMYRPGKQYYRYQLLPSVVIKSYSAYFYTDYQYR